MQLVNPSPIDLRHDPATPPGQVAAGLAKDASQQDLRYFRLERVDRTHAKSLARSCRVSPAAEKVSRILTNRWLIQSFLTSTPLIVADLFTMWFLLFGVSSIVERLCGVPTNILTKDTAFLASLLLLPIAFVARLYPAIGINAAVETRELVRVATSALVIFGGIEIALNPSNWSYYIASALLTLFLAIPFLPASRFVARAISRRFELWGAPVLIYTDSASVGAEMFRHLSLAKERGLRPVAVLFDEEKYFEKEDELASLGIPTCPVLNILEIALKTNATWLVLAKWNTAFGEDKTWSDDGVDALLHAIPNRVLLSYPGSFDCGLWDQTHTIGSSSGVFLAGSRYASFSLFLKRCIDIVFAGSICVFAAPLLIGIAIAIRLSSAGPILYGQTRVGRGGRSFRAWKFRTMVTDPERVLQQFLSDNPDYMREWQETHRLKNDPRFTWIGRFLRTTSFDELPQLWNILQGDMSLVGPRPIVNSPTYDATYIRDYPQEFVVYTTVRPGITGMWQVNCRNSGVYEMRIYWDMYYIRNFSLWLDLYIMLRTVRTVLLREGST